MANQIYLNRMPAGAPKPFSMLKKHKEYIDEHHAYIGPALIAERLGIPAITVFAYFHEKGYTPVKYNRKKPSEKKKKEGLFDYDAYMKGNLI